MIFLILPLVVLAVMIALDPAAMHPRRVAWLLAGSDEVTFWPSKVKNFKGEGHPYEHALMSTYRVPTKLVGIYVRMETHFWGWKVQRFYRMTDVDFRWVACYLEGVEVSRIEAPLSRVYNDGKMIRRPMQEYPALESPAPEPEPRKGSKQKPSEAVEEFEDVEDAEFIAIPGPSETSAERLNYYHDYEPLLRAIATAARGLAVAKAPLTVISPETGQETDNWTQTRAAMESYLARPLSRYEIMCLTLTRNFGPLPGASEDETQLLLEFLWPAPSLKTYTWAELAQAVEELKALA